MTLRDFLNQTDLEHSLLIGYYGGGNYGDELLLEVLQNLLKQRNVRDLTITYQDPSAFTALHHDLGYQRINMLNKKAVLTRMWRSKNIIIGGGGLWGVDMNFNTFLLSLLLFGARLFDKKVHLLGVGYYNSTNRLGRVGAWLAAKAAHTILARDQETFDNFNRHSKHVYMDTDIAWSIQDIDPAPYKQEVQALDKRLRIRGKTLFAALRRTQAKGQSGEFNHFTRLVAELLEHNRDKPIIVAPLESQAKMPAEYYQAAAWAERYPNVRVLEMPYNPLALFWLFSQHRKDLTLIGPQFHIIITAHLNNVPFMPMVYDNKVGALLNRIGLPQQEQLPLGAITFEKAQTFIDSIFNAHKVRADGPAPSPGEVA